MHSVSFICKLIATFVWIIGAASLSYCTGIGLVTEKIQIIELAIGVLISGLFPCAVSKIICAVMKAGSSFKKQGK